MAVRRRLDASLALTDENRRLLRFALQMLRSKERSPSKDERHQLQDELQAIPGGVIAGYMVLLGNDGYASPAIAGMDQQACQEIERLLGGGG
jgi:hypothetical protein